MIEYLKFSSIFGIAALTSCCWSIQSFSSPMLVPEHKMYRRQASNLNCGSARFQCKNGQCIDKAWICDGYKNCIDGSDETFELCKDRSCTSNKFHCKSGQCMDKSWLCDGYENCVDGSDETFELCKDNSCSSTKFHCKNGQCIERAWLCDGYKNCLDGSDETLELCKDHSCSSTKFHCKSGQCMNKAWLCDGYKNCLDGSDETLELCKDYSCTSTKFHCKSGQCMNKAWLCDGYKNCVDGSDETFELCKNNSCNSNKFHCKSGQCIEKAWLCDGYKNCLDGSDETLEQCKQYSCGKAFGNGKTSIIHGKAEEAGDSPWHVAIYSTAKSKDTELICGATIISKNLIVSAAHCFRDDFGNPESESHFEAVVAKLKRAYNLRGSDKTKIYKIKKIFYPPEDFLNRGLETYQGDIALLQTAEKITFNELVIPVCLDWTASGPFVPTQSFNGKLVGWGEDTTGKPSDALLAIIMPFVAKSRCKDLVSADFGMSIKEDKFCAGNLQGAGAKPGDSGGGLLFRDTVSNSYIIRGIASTKDNSNASIATFTDVGLYLDWIGTVENDISIIE